jgi:hypothetical protein
MWESHFNRNDYFEDSLVPNNDNATPDDYKLYKGTMYTDEKATLVWEKRSNYVAGSPPINQFTLSDLDLGLYDEADDTRVDWDTDANDNVHQVSASNDVDAVIKVYAYDHSFDGASTESYVLATEENFVQAIPPSFDVSLSLVSNVPPGTEFTVTADVTNNGDVAAHDNMITLSIPSGFSIVSGGNPQSIGSIEAGFIDQATWIVRSSTTPGTYSLSASNTSTCYAETYTGSSSSTPVTVPQQIAVDFGANGLWHYDGTTWSKMTYYDPDDMAGWVTLANCLAVDFGTNGLWNYDGMAWRKKSNWNAGSAGLVGWTGGLAVDFDGNGLWNYDGITWNKKTSWNPDDDMAGWDGGLAVDFGTSGLWNYNGTTWSKMTSWNPGSGGMAGWDGGLAVDFDSNGLWNFNGSTWSKKTSWNPGSGGLCGWTGGLAVDFDGNGLWNYNGTTWSKKTAWDPESMCPLGNGLAVDFGANGVWYYDGFVWSKKTNWNAENMTDVDLY